MQHLISPHKMQKRNQIFSFNLSLAVLSNKREKTTHLTAVKFIVISSIQLHCRYFLYENILHVIVLSVHFFCFVIWTKKTCCEHWPIFKGICHLFFL